jgi:phosphoglycolate phosphatase-like HAD superfamily hydrolase
VTWRVTDPVEAVRLRPAHVADELRHQLLTRIRRLALDFPPSHASQAAAALHKRLNVRMYGCTFRWNVTLSATTPPPAPARADNTARADNAVSAALRTAQAVILGFDGPLAELYTPDEPATVLRELAQFLTEARDPEDALSGQPLPHGDPVEGYANPLDLLRTFARHQLADELRLRLDTIETRAARTARPRTGADLLVRTLEARGTGLAVVTDHATLAVRTYLQRRGLDDAMNGGVHGRPTDLGRLMPHPHSPRQALDRLGVPPARCLMIGSTVAEQSVARFLGVPFLAFAPDERTRTRLLAAGGEQILVRDHTPLLNSLRALGSS